MRYKRKNAEIEAIQFHDTTERISEIFDFVGNLPLRVNYSGKTPVLIIEGSTVTQEADEGDYIIKDVSGDVYVCKCKDFEETYECAESNDSELSFSQVIPLLESGHVLRRSGWNGKGLIVFKQVPAHITEEIIPKMQSLPEAAKNFIMSGKKIIDYTSQCLIYNDTTGRADSWIPSISDVFAKDWELVK